MVWELLSPTNASCEPIQVVPGGSARLTVLQPPGGPAAGKGSMGSKGSKSSKAKPTVSCHSGTRGGGGCMWALVCWPTCM
jgi:hypothetical protein